MQLQRLAIATCALLLACDHSASSAAPREPEKAAASEPPAEPLTAAAQPSAAASAPSPPKSPEERARALAKRIILLDGHVDLPYRLLKGRASNGDPGEDVSERTERGHIDYVRARRGGLDAPFMSIYVPARYEKNGAKKLANQLIDIVVGLTEAHPDKLALARSPDEVRKNFAAGKISLPMGMENGAPIEGDLANVAYFHDRGIRYITLAHSKDNHISDSSYDTRHTNRGLSKFGVKVVAEMNRVGIMVDVSHLSDEAFADVLEHSRVPVIASHSSCRKFTPGWQRNMSDDMIRKLAAKGGVIQINFGSSFLSDEVRKQRDALNAKLRVQMHGKGIEWGTPAYLKLEEAFWKKHPAKRATVNDVADHIDHVVKLVGVDHVGLGSDFDGVGDSLPEGLRDASELPNLLRVLLERGYAEDDIEKIASGNVLRVWQRAEDHARRPAHD